MTCLHKVHRTCIHVVFLDSTTEQHILLHVERIMIVHTIIQFATALQFHYKYVILLHMCSAPLHNVEAALQPI